MDNINCIICFENEVEICCKFCSVKFHYKCLKQYNKTDCPQCKKTLPIIDTDSCLKTENEYEKKKKEELEIILSCLTILHHMKIFEESEQTRIINMLFKQRFNEDELITDYLEAYSSEEPNGVFNLIETAFCYNLNEARIFHNDYLETMKYFENIKKSILLVVKTLEYID